MKRLILVLSMLLPCAGTFAQQIPGQPAPKEVSLGSVHAEYVYDIFQIQYSIVLGEQVKDCDISLLISTDGGEVFVANPLETDVEGDVGRIRDSGDKVINYYISQDFLSTMVMMDARFAFKVVVSGIRYKTFSEAVSVGVPLIELTKDNVLKVSLSVACEELAKWKGICYSEDTRLPTFEKSKVVVFPANNEPSVVSLDVTPGKTYYLRGIAVGKEDDSVVYGKPVKIVVPKN